MCLNWNIQKHNKIRLAAFDIVIIALMVAIIEVCKVAFAQIPNVELTSFFIIVFSLYFGKRIFYVIPVFVLIEGAIWGFGLWWIMYLYTWPLLAIGVFAFRKMKSAFEWAIFSGVFGLLFGFFCAIPYVFISGVKGAITWWIAGIPWDLVHGITNFVIMLVLFYPIKENMKKIATREYLN